MNNYIPYNPNSIRNNYYPLDSINSLSNKFPFLNFSLNEQRNQNKSTSKIYTVHNNNFFNDFPNSTNNSPKNKNVSLQEQILSPNIEDSRPSIPINIYYDDSRYKNFINWNYNDRYSNNKKPTNNKPIYDTDNFFKEKKGIFDIKEHKKIDYTKKMLILDLDETLVHSCFKPTNYNTNNNNLPKADIFLNIKFNSKYHEVLVYKRPFVDEFLEKMNKYYNLIIFTASVQEYADPLLDQLDKNKYIKLRYYRNSCLLDKNGKFVKNLSSIYNDLKNVILLDNNPISYSYNKNNGLPIITWHFDKKDRELLKIIPILEFLSTVDDIRNYLPRFVEFDMVNFTKFNLLIDEINKQKESNNFFRDRPKTSKHISSVKKERPKNQKINNNNNNSQNVNEDEIKKNKENKNMERNRHHSLNKNNIKYSTINNTYDLRTKESVNTNKSFSVKKIDLNNAQNINNEKNNEIIYNQKRKEKNKKRKINNLFNKSNKLKKMKDNKEEKIYLDKNRSIDFYLQKDNTINQSGNNRFIIINEKQKNKNNENSSINLNNLNNVQNKHYDKNNPFIIKSAEKIENKKFSFLNGLNKKEENNNIQINIINNIQQINLFKNNNIKKIDIINYYKNNSEKKAQKMNKSYIFRENPNKIKLENNLRNQSYTKKNSSKKIFNKNTKNDIHNSHLNHTAQNFYPHNKTTLYKDNNHIINHTINKEITNTNMAKNEIIKIKNQNYYYKKDNNFQYNNLYNMMNKNNLINSNSNNMSQDSRNTNQARMSNFNDNNYVYKPWNYNGIENSNFNSMYNNNNFRYSNNLYNIHPYYLQNNNSISRDYSSGWNNNYNYKNQRIFY